MLSLAILLSIAAPDAWSACLDESAPSAFSACTALISSDAAIALYNRGNAWRAAAMRQRAQAGAADANQSLDRAIDDYTRALKARPDLAEALINRGVAWYEKRRYDRAIADYDAAIAMRPDVPEAWNNRALAWHKAGRHDLALRDFDQTIRLYKDYGNALINRAMGSIRP